MEWTDDDKRRVGRALADSRYRLRELLNREPSGSEIVFNVIKDAIFEIERRIKLPGHTRPMELRGAPHAYVHEAHEIIEAAKQRRIDEAAGDDPAKVWGITFVATPLEIDTMDSAKKVFVDCIVGHNKVRDWKVLRLLAAGGAVRRVAKQFHIGKSRVDDIKKLQCSAIWTRVRDLMPLGVGGGTVWKSDDSNYSVPQVRKSVIAINIDKSDWRFGPGGNVKGVNPVAYENGKVIKDAA